VIVAELSTKERIIRVSTKFFAQNGYDGTSLNSIAAEVGMKKPSLLYHYPNKEALREAVLQDLLARWQVRLPEILAAATTGNRRFEELFSEVVQYFRDDPNRAALIIREMVGRPKETRERVSRALAPWLGMLVQAIEQGKEAGRVRADVDPEAYLTEMVVLIVGAFVAADLSTAVFPGQTGQERLDRIITEITRMGRFSLFVERL
jgi:AcrR family transcriptional regulator